MRIRSFKHAFHAGLPSAFDHFCARTRVVAGESLGNTSNEANPREHKVRALRALKAVWRGHSPVRSIGKLIRESFLSFVTKRRVERGPEAIGTIALIRVFDAVDGLDSACLVFAHSVLDDVSQQCLRAVALVAPAEFEDYLSSRKVTLGQAKTNSYSSLLGSLLEENLASLLRESLRKRIDLLCSKCRPSSERAEPNRYRLDLNRIEAIDKVRQDIIHRVQLDLPLTDLDGTLKYIEDTCRFLVSMVCTRYCISLDFNNELIAGPPDSEVSAVDANSFRQSLDALSKDVLARLEKGVQQIEKTVERHED